MLPTNASQRKNIPLSSGLVDYFSSALVAVAALSAAGNKQHHDGTPLHWDRSKSSDHDDALMRHFIERGTLDTDGLRHTAKVAWRALALLQEELEREEGAPLPRNAVVVPPPPNYDPNDVAFRYPHSDLTTLGIGDVPHLSMISPSLGITDVPNPAHLATNAAISQHVPANVDIGPNVNASRHPMASEVLRQWSERDATGV